jgi:ATP-dependent Clp protease protease subunit
MMERRIPQWLNRAREIHARVASPVGVPFAAKSNGKVAKLYLYDAIGRDMFSDAGIAPTDVVAALAEAKGAGSLEVYINSPGGFVFDGIAIYNAIRQFNGPKTVFVDGIAASIASIIALAGDKVVTQDGAMWMIHDPMGGLMSMGTAEEIEDDARKTVNALRKVRENLLDIYTSATGQSIGDISAWMGEETWMTAAEAQARGFTDEVARVEADPPPVSKPQKAQLSPALAARDARVRAEALRERFPGASPEGKPGQPDRTPTTGRTTT